jgi:drug/metabolite transporter (DMT)-like permease
MTISNKNEDPATVSLLCQIGIVYNYICDKVFFAIQFSDLQVLGCSIVFLSVLAAAVCKLRAK